MFCTSCLVNLPTCNQISDFRKMISPHFWFQISHNWVFLCFWLLCFFLLDTLFQECTLVDASVEEKQKKEKRKTHWAVAFMVVAEENTHYWRILWEVCNGCTKNKATPFGLAFHCTFSSNNCPWLYLEATLEDWWTQYGTFEGVQFSLDDLHYYFLFITPFLLQLWQML